MVIETRMGQQKETVKLGSTETVMEDPMKLKEAGNDAFKAGDYEEALSKYTRAMEITDKEADRSLLLKNRAAVNLKTENFQAVVDDCTAALEITPQDPKALYRRCQAYESLDKVDLAYNDAKTCLLYTSPSPRDKRQSRMPSSA